jgi:hypothetical protein
MLEYWGENTFFACDGSAVFDDVHLTRYVAKQLADESVRNFWPRHFRPTSFTRNWCPEWLSREQYNKNRKLERENAASGNS